MSELGSDQKDLAAAAEVTESYISQLLARKKEPPAPGRTDIYEKIGQFLKLPPGELARLAEIQRQQGLIKKIAESPRPLFQDCRALILRKCRPEIQSELKRIFDKEPFGELERLVTQKLLDVVHSVAREELRSEVWLRRMAQARGLSYEQVRVAMLEFLDTDIFHITLDGCVSFLEPMIDYWDIDLHSFAIEVTLNPRLAPGGVRRYEFSEKSDDVPPGLEPGFEQFLNDPLLSGDTTEEELEFLRRLRFKGRSPSPLYYYRELQSLRDPLHFPALRERSGETRRGAPQQGGEA